MLGFFDDIFQQVDGNAHETDAKLRRTNFRPDRRETSGFCGLDNSGNTCYLNSVLQSLYMTPEIRNSILSLNPQILGIDKLNEFSRIKLERKRKKAEAEAKSVVPANDDDAELIALGILAAPEKKDDLEAADDANDDGHTSATNSLPFCCPYLLEFQRLFSSLSLSNRRAIGTRYLSRNAFQWDDDAAVKQTSQQQDIHELTRLVLSSDVALDKDLSKLKKKQIKGNVPMDVDLDFISRTFRGQTVRRIECMTCHTISERFEDFYDFLISLQENAESDMVEFMHRFKSAVEEMTESTTGCYECSNCGRKVPVARITNGFSSLPPVLVVSLGRFGYDPRTWQRMKISKRFDFPFLFNASQLTRNSSVYASDVLNESADLNKMMMTMMHDDDDDWYDLYSIICHSGGSTRSGHYYCYVKDVEMIGHFEIVKDHLTKLNSGTSSKSSSKSIQPSDDVKIGLIKALHHIIASSSSSSSDVKTMSIKNLTQELKMIGEKQKDDDILGLFFHLYEKEEGETWNQCRKLKKQVGSFNQFIKSCQESSSLKHFEIMYDEKSQMIGFVRYQDYTPNDDNDDDSQPQLVISADDMQAREAAISNSSIFGPWFLFNDSSVTCHNFSNFVHSEVTKNVFEGSDSAYMLFYRRRSGREILNWSHRQQQHQPVGSMVPDSWRSFVSADNDLLVTEEDEYELMVNSVSIKLIVGLPPIVHSSFDLANMLVTDVSVDLRNPTKAILSACDDDVVISDYIIYQLSPLEADKDGRVFHVIEQQVIDLTKISGNSMMMMIANDDGTDVRPCFKSAQVPERLVTCHLISDDNGPTETVFVNLAQSDDALLKDIQVHFGPLVSMVIKINDHLIVGSEDDVVASDKDEHVELVCCKNEASETVLRSIVDGIIDKRLKSKMIHVYQRDTEREIYSGQMDVSIATVEMILAVADVSEEQDVYLYEDKREKLIVDMQVELWSVLALKKEKEVSLYIQKKKTTNASSSDFVSIYFLLASGNDKLSISTKRHPPNLSSTFKILEHVSLDELVSDIVAQMCVLSAIDPTVPKRLRVIDVKNVDYGSDHEASSIVLPVVSSPSNIIAFADDDCMLKSLSSLMKLSDGDDDDDAPHDVLLSLKKSIESCKTTTNEAEKSKIKKIKTNKKKKKSVDVLAMINSCLFVYLEDGVAPSLNHAFDFSFYLYYPMADGSVHDMDFSEPLVAYQQIQSIKSSCFRMLGNIPSKDVSSVSNNIGLETLKRLLILPLILQTFLGSTVFELGNLNDGTRDLVRQLIHDNNLSDLLALVPLDCILIREMGTVDLLPGHVAGKNLRLLKKQFTVELIQAQLPSQPSMSFFVSCKSNDTVKVFKWPPKQLNVFPLFGQAPALSKGQKKTTTTSNDQPIVLMDLVFAISSFYGCGKANFAIAKRTGKKSGHYWSVIYPVTVSKKKQNTRNSTAVQDAFISLPLLTSNLATSPLSLAHGDVLRLIQLSVEENKDDDDDWYETAQRNFRSYLALHSFSSEAVDDTSDMFDSVDDTMDKFQAMADKSYSSKGWEGEVKTSTGSGYRESGLDIGQSYDDDDEEDDDV